MFRCFSLLGIVAVSFGIAALVSAASRARMVPVKVTGAKRRPIYTRIPGLKYHLVFSMN
jgi:hypothetical protein